MMKKVLLVGSSYMAEEHLKVLKQLGCDVTVLGRNTEKAQTFAEKYGFKGLGGGTASIKDAKEFDCAIIASSVESLKEVSADLVKKGFKQLLIEKPGAMNLKELEELSGLTKVDMTVKVAYNRRYYNSVLMLKKRIEEEGIVGFFFDFTDREKDLKLSKKDPGAIKLWGFNNSTHVIDTAFFLGGMPENVGCEREGGGKEHPSGTIFVGHGKTKKCLFSYFATWSGGGRWNVEVSTPTGRYKLSPLEELHFMEKNQFNIVKIEAEDDDDKKFKPGVLKMDKAFLEGKADLLPSLHEQVELCKVACKIFGYS